MRKLVFFRETRHAFGRTALLLSGGASMTMHHLGVVRALYEDGLLPRVISGSSGVRCCVEHVIFVIHAGLCHLKYR